MSQKRDLGPILALAGGGIALAAVVAGFIITGGPGDARDRRLDELTGSRMLAVASVLQCAYSIDGSVPTTFAEALRRRGRPGPTHAELECASTATYGGQFPVVSGRTPATSGEVSYEVVEDDRVAICGNFRTAYQDKGECLDLCPSMPDHMSIGNTRSTGVNCYEVQLYPNPAQKAPASRQDSP